MTAPALVRGDYVLATKYRDGDPGDHFAVGFYDRAIGDDLDRRHVVTDSAGVPFRANGFRRVERISEERGRWLIERFGEIERAGRSVWWWRRRAIHGRKQGGKVGKAPL